MAQLTDDCFAFGGELVLVDDALATLAERVNPVAAKETIDIANAIGRFLAEDIIAPRDVPPHDNSAVDGYAVFFGDLNLKAKTRLPKGGNNWRNGTRPFKGDDCMTPRSVSIFTYLLTRSAAISRKFSSSVISLA